MNLLFHEMPNICPVSTTELGIPDAVTQANTEAFRLNDFASQDSSGIDSDATTYGIAGAKYPT